MIDPVDVVEGTMSFDRCKCMTKDFEMIQTAFGVSAPLSPFPPTHRQTPSLDDGVGNAILSTVQSLSFQTVGYCADRNNRLVGRRKQP